MTTLGVHSLKHEWLSRLVQRSIAPLFKPDSGALGSKVQSEAPLIYHRHQHPLAIQLEIPMSEKTTRLQKLADELIEAAQRLGVEVRREKILREVGYRARGGPCRLREQDLIIIDREMAPAEQLELLAEVLKDREHEQLYLSPAARKLLQSNSESA